MKRVISLLVISLLISGGLAISAEEVMVPLEAVKSTCFDEIDMSKTEFPLTKLNQGCVREDWLKDQRKIDRLNIEGLVGYWPMEQAEGHTIKGKSKDRHTGTAHETTWVKGKRGFGLYFDGENAHGQVEAKFDELSSWTLTLWMTIGRLPIEDRQFYCQFEGSNPATDDTGSVYFTLEPTEDGQKFIIWGGEGMGGNLSYEVPSGWQEGEWHHLAIKQVRSENRRYLYLDGKLLASETNSEFNNINTLKSVSHHAAPWFGAIDELRLYDKALTGAEITSIYDKTK